MPGLEQVTHHTLVITQWFPISQRNAKTFQLLLTPVCQLCTISLREEASVQWKQEQSPVMMLWTAITKFIWVTTTSWSSTWSVSWFCQNCTCSNGVYWFLSLDKVFDRIRGSFFGSKESFSEKFAYTSWLWVPEKECSEPVKGASLPQTCHQHWLVVHESSKGSVLQPSWVLEQGGLIRARLSRCLLCYSSSQEDPEGSKNMIFSYYDHQSVSYGHIFLFQMY